MGRRSRRTLFAIVVVLSVVGAACTSTDVGADSTTVTTSGGTEITTTTTADTTPAEPLRIAMISGGEVLLGGWYAAVDIGRQYLEDNVGGITVDVIENVSAGQVAQSTLEDLASEGYGVIISTDVFDADLAVVAPEYPDTVFLQSCDATMLDNMGQFCPAVEQARYADGVLAASLSESGKIGYVLAFDVPFVIKPLNAFVRGAQSVNPDIIVEVIGTNSWFDPSLERQAAESLVNNGADVLTYDLSSSAIPEVASENGIAFVGFGYEDAAAQAPDAWVGGSLYNWGPIFVEQVELVLAGEWETNYAYAGFEADYLAYSDIPDSVPDDVRADVESVIAGLADGSIDPFAGPIYDRDGNLVVPEGETADVGFCCEWVIDGVVGEVG